MTSLATTTGATFAGSTRDRVRRLQTGGPQAAFEDSTFEQETIALGEGDTMILFSDGVTEAGNSRNEEFGEDRLTSYVIANRSAPAGDLVKGILQTVTKFSAGAPQADDISVTVVRYTAAPRCELAPIAGAIPKTDDPPPANSPQFASVHKRVKS